MGSEYDPVVPEAPPGVADDDLERVQAHFRAASRPYLASPWSWLAWALVLPGAALATPPLFARFGAAGVLFLWSAAILVGGAIEVGGIFGRGARGSTPLASWALRVQGNLSLVAVALSLLLLVRDLAWVLPGLWLLLLGHSLYLMGGLAFAPLRTCGVIYQLGGLAALWPRLGPLAVFALTTAIGNLYLAAAVWRDRRAAA